MRYACSLLALLAGCVPVVMPGGTPVPSTQSFPVSGVALVAEGSPVDARVAGVVGNESPEPARVGVLCRVLDSGGGVVAAGRIVVGPVEPGGTLPFTLPLSVGPRKAEVVSADAVADATYPPY